MYSCCNDVLQLKLKLIAVFVVVKIFLNHCGNIWEVLSSPSLTVNPGPYSGSEEVYGRKRPVQASGKIRQRRDQFQTGTVHVHSNIYAS
jgi:hypothetical protein